jgi:hypothetical protein
MAIAVAGAAASGPVPTATAGAIRKAAAPNAFLPRSVPSGYRYVGWKNENPNGNAAVSSGMFFVVTFAHGSSKLVWTVSLVPDPVGSPCGGTSVAHATVGGQPVYRSALTTYDPLGSGPKGRHVWRCVNAPGGGDTIRLDAWDQGGTLPIPIVSRLVAQASST